MKRRIYVFGGYDGENRLADFHYYVLADEEQAMEQTSIKEDLFHYVNNPSFSDLTLKFPTGEKLSAHKIMLSRCDAFKTQIDALEESKSEEPVIEIDKISYDTALQLIRYLYTDECEITLENSITLLKAADEYGIERLKLQCESTISSCINDDNVSNLLIESDKHSAETLKEITLNYILNRFDSVSKTEAFALLVKSRPELVVMEILQKR